MILKNELSIFKSLVYYRLFCVKSVFIDKIINTAIWTIGTILVMGYLMQYFGLTANYGAFQLAGIVGLIGVFEFFEMSVRILADLEGDSLFGYHASLACSLPTVLIAYVVAQALVTISLSLLVVPLGKILLWNKLLLANISWLSLMSVIFVANLFSAIFGLWIVTIMRSLDKRGNIWQRVIFPMWFFGGFQFSYAAVLSVWPTFSYFMLINPVTYATEGVRSAMLGGDFLNPWLCMGVLLVFSVGFFFDSVRRYRNWLDLV